MMSFQINSATRRRKSRLTAPFAFAVSSQQNIVTNYGTANKCLTRNFASFWFLVRCFLNRELVNEVMPATSQCALPCFPVVCCDRPTNRIEQTFRNLRSTFFWISNVAPPATEGNDTHREFVFGGSLNRFVHSQPTDAFNPLSLGGELSWI